MIISNEEKEMRYTQYKTEMEHVCNKSLELLFMFFHFIFNFFYNLPFLHNVTRALLYIVVQCDQKHFHIW
jgi:hypothetical protein